MEDVALVQADLLLKILGRLNLHAGPAIAIQSKAIPKWLVTNAIKAVHIKIKDPFPLGVVIMIKQPVGHIEAK